MNLHAKAFSYSMEPCVRILCVRAGRVELRVGRPLLLFFCAPRENCFSSAGLDSVMQDHTRAHARGRMRVRRLNQMEWWMHACVMWCYWKTAHIISLCVKCRILPNWKFVVCESNITDTARHVLFGEWGLTCQLIASADLSSFRITLHPPRPHSSDRAPAPQSTSRLAPSVPCWAASATHHCASMQVQTGGVGGSLKWIPVWLFLPTETPLKNQLGPLGLSLAATRSYI